MSTDQRGKRENIILLSIDSDFARAIYEGEKTYEFRKTALPQDTDYIVLLENGTREITGGFAIEEIHEEDVQTLWEKFGRGISERQRFFDYYSGWDKGLAIEISEAEKYKEPINIDELTIEDPLLEVPDRFHFIYMSNRSVRQLSNYSRILGDILPRSKETTLDRYGGERKQNENLNFKPMESSEEDEFRELFSHSPVPADYADITQDFIDHILKSHNIGVDPYGYFTLRKKVYSLFSQDDLIGFTTLTWKRGGSVKYGPTVLKEEVQGRGFGPKLRKLIDSNLKHSGVRKTYSTIPETGTSAYKYLIKSGYKVEAHLHNQYNTDHSELVFGKVLHNPSPPSNIDIERDQLDSLEHEVGSKGFDKFANFVIKSARPWYDEIDTDFVKSVQEAEERGLKSQYSLKGKRVFIGHLSKDIKAVAISSKKRGDAVKVSPIFSSVSGKALDEFIEFIEKDLNSHKSVRKIYTHIPVLDQQLAHALMTHSYQTEGILRQPYKDGIDMLVLAKMVDE